MSADFTPDKEDYKILPPFKMQVLTNFPYIEADFDALTNYQLLCKIVEYLNAVIHNENEVTEQITSLYNAYVSLQDYVNDYFDNLDVQEEINNKLDEMAEDGSLTNLIKAYVDPIYEAYENTINLRLNNQDTEISTFKTTVTGQIAAQNTRISAVESGSPLVASSIDDMTETDRVYVNTTDGKWYYYDGDSWEIGGTYQTSGLPTDINNINQALLTTKETVAYTNTQSNNLLNKYYNITPNKYILNGVEHSSDAFDLTDYIEIDENKEIWCVHIGNSSFYDVNKDYISGDMPTTGNDHHTTPANAKYIRCSLSHNYSDYFLGYTSQYRISDSINYYIPPLYEDGLIRTTHFKKFEPDYITFTVPINQDEDDTANENIVDVKCVLRLPPKASNQNSDNKGYTPDGKPCPLIMLIHGAGAGVSNDYENWTLRNSYNSIVNYFVTSGYAVFDCNGYNNTSRGINYWGNIKGVRAYMKAYQYITQNYNVEKDVNIYAFSMGGLTAMQLINIMPNIKCLAMGSPVLSMEACWDDPTLTSGLKEIYNIPAEVTDYDYSYFYGSDPMQRILNNRYYGSCPDIKIWYGSTETSGCTNKQYAIDMVNALKNAGFHADYREVSGYGHEICYGDITSVNLEYLKFINRHNNTKR